MTSFPSHTLYPNIKQTTDFISRDFYSGNQECLTIENESKEIVLIGTIAANLIAFVDEEIHFPAVLARKVTGIQIGEAELFVALN